MNNNMVIIEGPANITGEDLRQLLLSALGGSYDIASDSWGNSRAITIPSAGQAPGSRGDAGKQIAVILTTWTQVELETMLSSANLNQYKVQSHQSFDGTTVTTPVPAKLLNYMVPRTGQTPGYDWLSSFSGALSWMGGITRSFMEDCEASVYPLDPNIPALPTAHYHPKTLFVEGGIGKISSTDLLKYNVINSNGTNFNALKNAQDAGHNFICRGMSPMQTMESAQYANQSCGQGWNIPFTGTTASAGDPVDSTNYGVLANATDCPRGGVPIDWWLLRDGSTSTTKLFNGSANVTVVDVSKYSQGSYVVIRPSINDWTGAEILRVDTITNSVLGLTRGYLSDIGVHEIGAYIAQISLGDNGNKLFWQFNMSTQCPVDGNGVRPNTYIADWLNTVNPASGVLNLFTPLNGSTDNSAINFKGIIYDVDRDYTLDSNADCYNDGTVDIGFGVAGEPVWLDGVNVFHDTIRNNFPALFQVGGTHFAGGVADGMTGTQYESLPTGFTNSAYSYGNLSSWMVGIEFWRSRVRRGSGLGHALFKQSSIPYQIGNQNPPLNSPIRMMMGYMMMGDTYIHHQALGLADSDVWYDEYAVNLNGSHATLAYGQSPIKTNSADCLSSNNWLGAPLEDRRRIYDYNTFDPANDLLNGAGDFTNGIAGWTTTNLSIANAGDELNASVQTNYSRDSFGAKIKSPVINAKKNTQYTICFEAKAGILRRISVLFGGHKPSSIHIDDTFKKYVMVFNPTADGNTSFEFQVGGDNTTVDIRNVLVFSTPADLFIREFTNGIVILNLNNQAETVDLGSGLYQRLQGANGAGSTDAVPVPQDAINDGSLIADSSSVTVPARDMLLLVRQE